jgi:hypothetical protein
MPEFLAAKERRERRERKDFKQENMKTENKGDLGRSLSSSFHPPDFMFSCKKSFLQFFVLFAFLCG